MSQTGPMAIYIKDDFDQLGIGIFCESVVGTKAPVIGSITLLARPRACNTGYALLYGSAY